MYTPFGKKKMFKYIYIYEDSLSKRYIYKQYKS